LADQTIDRGLPDTTDTAIGRLAKDALARHRVTDVRHPADRYPS
jgi:hypothetical protein